MSSSAARSKPGAFLDVRSLVVYGGEQGLLGLAFSPSYARDHTFYVNYTARPDGSTRVVRYRSRNGRALPRSAQQILRIDQPYANHNGGNLVFGPDGRLWVGMGDGGSGGDPENRAQNPDSLLGKMLRLDVRRANPTPEIFALGLRNPWRFSFDRKTKDLWIGDVGQGSIEEIDHLPRATTGLINFGWDVYEGRSSYEDKALGPGRLVQPVAQYTPRRRLLGHRRVRLPRERGAGAQGPLRVRRLLQRHDLEHAGDGRCAPRRARQGAAAHVVRAEPRRRPALHRLADRRSLALRGLSLRRV